MHPKPTGDPANQGTFPFNWDVWAFNRTGAAIAVGVPVRFDITAAQAETSAVQTDTGAESHPLANFSACIVTDGTTQASVAHGIFGVVVDLGVDGGADNTRVRVRLKGYLERVLNTGTVAAGARLCPAAGVLAPSAVAGAKCVAIAMTNDDTPATGYCAALFDGVNGFYVFAVS